MSIFRDIFEKSVPDFDFSGLVSPKVGEMGKPFEGNTLYKFYGENLLPMIGDPTIRFTQRGATLNDPFELTIRWKETVSKTTSEKLEIYLRSSFERAFSDDGHIMRTITLWFARKGILLNDDQIKEVSTAISSGRAKDIFSQIKDDLNKRIGEFLVNLNKLRDEFDKFLSEDMSKLGVFSTTEDINSDQMWGLYASSGKGFALEIDPYNEIFRVKKGDLKGSSLFRKVLYTDEYCDDFLSNPYFLFLVKKSKWSFEKEWRILKYLETCELKDNTTGVYRDRLPKFSIKSVIFGYNVPNNLLDKYISDVHDFDDNILVRKMKLNHIQGNLYVDDI